MCDQGAKAWWSYLGDPRYAQTSLSSSVRGSFSVRTMTISWRLTGSSRRWWVPTWEPLHRALAAQRDQSHSLGCRLSLDPLGDSEESPQRWLNCAFKSRGSPVLFLMHKAVGETAVDLFGFGRELKFYSCCSLLNIFLFQVPHHLVLLFLQCATSKPTALGSPELTPSRCLSLRPWAFRPHSPFTVVFLSSHLMFRIQKHLNIFLYDHFSKI